MNDAPVYLRLGIEHLLDPRGLDHVAFIAALTAPYGLQAWRHLLVLVTAFTAGHTLTLALATVGLVRVDAGPVEVLIPLSIVLAALYSIWGVRRDATRAAPAASRRVEMGRYALTLVFGLIHGLGFSTFLRGVLGAEQQLLVPLLAFNVGLELAQLAVLSVLLGLGALVVRGGVRPEAWAYGLSSLSLGVGLVMLVARLTGG